MATTAQDKPYHSKTSILYFGNALAKHGYAISTMEEHSRLLAQRYKVFTASSRLNPVARLFDMFYTFLFRQRACRCIILSTFSTRSFYFTWCLALIARFFKKSYITYLHGGNLPARLRQSPVLSSHIFKHAYANIAPSAYLGDAFEKQGYSVKIIPNFIHLSAYPNRERSYLQPNILWVRAFEQTYHPEMALEVLVLLRQRFPQARLCMVGPDKDGSLARCQSLAQRLQIDDAITFTGKLEKKDWIQRAHQFDIFINTTHYDNMPVSVLEAMALGMPVVSTKVGGIPYLIEHESNGLLCANGDAVGMNDQIIRLLENPKLAQALSKNGRAKALSYDWTAVQQQWFSLIDAAACRS